MKHSRSTLSHRRRRPRAEAAAFALKALPLALALCFCPLVLADPINPGQAGLPMGGAVASGTVGSALTADKLTLTQTTQRAVIDWASFNIASGKEVQFIQPNASAAVLNRVSAGANMSEIAGTLSANGTVLLMNPNGVMFHQGSNINVGSLIVSTGTVNQAAFEAGGTSGAFGITGATTGSITNQGRITVANAGLVALVAPSVVNQGTILATSGRIRLSGADRGTVSFNGNLFEFAVDSGAQGTNATVGNMAGASLEGAHILLTTGDAANLVSGVINLQGVQRASSAIVVDGNTVVLKSDLNAPSISGRSNTVQVHDTASLQDAVDVARTGGLVQLAAGTHAQAVTLNVNKSLTLEGAGEAATVIDLRSVSGYGVNVSANDVTLRDFTVYGPTAFSTTQQSSYGIKVSPGNTAAFPLRNFSITRVTSRGAGKAELDLNGVNGALIDQVTLNGAPVGNDTATTEGAGLQLTDSANVTVRNSTTLNNKWGGLALYQANRSYSQQVNNITIEGNNRFGELNPVYLQDLSASFDFGSLNIAGFGYAVGNASSVTSHQYTWLQATKQKGYDFAVSLPGHGASYIQGWNGSGRTQVFEVGVGNQIVGSSTQAQAMSIATAINQSSTGATINVGAGTYGEQITLNKAGLTLKGDGAKLQVPDLADINAITISANNVTVEGMEIAGPLNGVPYYTYYRSEQGYTTPGNISRGIVVGSGVANFTIRNNNVHDLRTGILIHGNNGAGNVVANNRIENTKSGISVQYTGGSGIDIAGNSEGTNGNEWGVNLNLNRYANESLKQEAPDLAWQQHLLDLSAGNSGWFVQDQGFRSSNRTVVNVATAASGGRPGVQGSRLTPMNSVQGGVNAVVAGGTVNVQSGSYAERVTVDSPRKLRFSGTTLQGLTLNAGAGNSGIGGNVSVSGAEGILFNAPVNLLSDTTLAATSGSIALNGLLQSGASGLTLNAADDVTGTVQVPSLNVTAGNRVDMSLDVGSADVRAGVQADLSGRATRIGVDAPHGNLTGSFNTVDNTGNGVLKVNGRALQSEPVAAVIDNIRFVPVIVLPPLPPAPSPPPPAPVMLQASVDIDSQPATAAGAGTGAPSGGAAPAAGGSATTSTSTSTRTSSGGQGVVASISGPRQVTVTRGAPGKAADALALGQGVEIDLSPGR
ncbi:MAG: filamentous hemagglutinin N-terminal domain-containing protein [Hylemonella sp.]|nr:filamentous hemagglutinin N-terminal domain-containing protein [Hylemonella sp.]